MSTLSEYLADLRNIARYTRLEVRRAYRDVGPVTAAHVAVAVPAYLLRLWWRDKVRGGDGG